MSKIIKVSSALIPEMNQCGNAGFYNRLSESSELRRRALQKEKNNEKAAAILLDRLTKHTGIVRKGRTFLIIFSFITLVAAMYLMHLESVNRHLQSPGFKITAR